MLFLRNEISAFEKVKQVTYLARISRRKAMRKAHKHDPHHTRPRGC